MICHMIYRSPQKRFPLRDPRQAEEPRERLRRAAHVLRRGPFIC